MNIVTIPKKLAKEDDLIVVPRKEYEALLRVRAIEEFEPTIAQKKALIMAESHFRRRKTLSYDELTRKLGFGGRPQRF